MVACGEVPGLFAHDEIERMFPNAEEIKNEYYGKTLYEAFIERCRKNLKIILSMDNSNRDFTANCASNPALFTKCRVVWLSSMTKESMHTFLKEELKESVLKDMPPKELDDFAN